MWCGTNQNQVYLICYSLALDIIIVIEKTCKILETKARSALMIGYSTTQNAYKLWEDTL